MPKLLANGEETPRVLGVSQFTSVAACGECSRTSQILGLAYQESTLGVGLEGNRVCDICRKSPGGHLMDCRIPVEEAKRLLPGGRLKYPAGPLIIDIEATQVPF